MKTPASGRRSRPFFSAQPRAAGLFEQQRIKDSARFRERQRASLIQELLPEDVFRRIPKCSSPLMMLQKIARVLISPRTLSRPLLCLPFCAGIR
jgi:hypothetical protein